MKTNVPPTIIQKTNIIIYPIFICISIFAQKEGVLKIKNHEITVPQQLILSPFSTDLEQYSSGVSTFQKYLIPTKNLIFNINETNPFSRITFNQNRNFAPINSKITIGF